ncbi:MAG: reverse transcriptase/maturase family protein [Candidatus Paceibacterota bacterium]|jgi:retron-type reverse transcriptase
MRKFIKPYSEIATVENLLIAWQEFLPGKKNRLDVELFQSRLMNNIFFLHHDLLYKRYVHGGYQAFNISDPKPRNIHKATVRDRLLHHLLYNELYTYFDTKFIFDSYSCRLNKGTHKALNQFRKFAGKVSKNHTRTCWVLKCDIRKFFASIDHTVLKSILEKHIANADTLRLLENIIDSFETQNSIYAMADICKDGGGNASAVVKGLPLGNLTSQLLVNIYMNEFDHFMKRELKTKYYIRYADDFVILSESKAYVENLLPKIHKFLSERLRLSLHPDKVFIKTYSSGVDFLGWVHFPHHRVLRTSTKRKMLKRLKGEPKLETIAAYKGMLLHGDTYKICKPLHFLL